MSSVSMVDGFSMPGIGTAIESTEREFMAGYMSSWQAIFVDLDSTTIDSGNTPTTLLRRGLLLGRDSTTGRYENYDPTATDGTEVAIGILLDNVNMLDASGAAENKMARMIWHGYVKADQILLLDAAARAQLNNRIWFDDFINGQSFGLNQRVVAKAADYTVVAADNNKIFTTQGAGAQVTFTLPTLARGLHFTFYNEANQNMVIAAPGSNDTLVAFNDLSADTLTFSQANELIGACVEVFANADATKWLVRVSLAAEAQTSIVA